MWQENNESVRKLLIRAEDLIPRRFASGVVDSKSKNQFLDSSSGFSLDKSFLNTFITIIIEISATIVSDIGVAIQTPRAPKISGKSKAAGT